MSDLLLKRYYAKSFPWRCTQFRNTLLFVSYGRKAVLKTSENYKRNISQAWPHIWYTRGQTFTVFTVSEHNYIFITILQHFLLNFTTIPAFLSINVSISQIPKYLIKQANFQLYNTLQPLRLNKYSFWELTFNSVYCFATLSSLA